MDVLAAFADNQSLVEEVKKVLRRQFTEDDARTDAISDELLGQMYRARLVGLQKIDDAFAEIAKHKSRKEGSTRGVNPAR